MAEEIKANGYYYNGNGEYVISTGSLKKVYLASEYTETKDPKTKKITIKLLEVEDLNIKIDDFCYIAGVIREEDKSFIGIATAIQTTFNAVKLIKGDDLTMEKQAEYSKKLLEGSKYSTVGSSKKKKISFDKNDVLTILNARKALIHVLTGGEDYSLGAVRWDGVDFAANGSKHRKANSEGGIEISKKLWNEFVDVTSEKELKAYGKTKEEARKLITFETEKITPISRSMYGLALSRFGTIAIIQSLIVDDKDAEPPVTLPNGTIFFKDKKDEKYYMKKVALVDPFISYGTGNNKGLVLNKALIVRGQQIFWGANKKHPSNKKYNWKWYFANIKL